MCGMCSGAQFPSKMPTIACNPDANHRKETAKKYQKWTFQRVHSSVRQYNTCFLINDFVDNWVLLLLPSEACPRRIVWKYTTLLDSLNMKVITMLSSSFMCKFSSPPVC
jgi:hypothetical protein